MNDLQIRYFLGVVNNDVSFTKAARALYVSQPALSKHINNLEEELGVTLLDTTKKSAIKLTPGGELLYEYFTANNNKLKETVEEAKILNKQPRGELKIAIVSGWGEVLIGKITAFSQQHPSIDLTMDSLGFKAINNGLIHNNYDLVITMENQFADTPNVAMKPLARVPGILLFSKNHALAQKTDLCITDFRDEVFYALSLDDAPWVKSFQEAYCKSKGFMPMMKLLPNVESIFLVLETGKGCAIFDRWIRIKNNAAYKYFELDKDMTVSAAWKERNQNPALQLFLNTLGMLDENDSIARSMQC
jgi:DNA-binding transcriptional LysR family regulator